MIAQKNFRVCVSLASWIAKLVAAAPRQAIVVQRLLFADIFVV